MDHKKTVSHIIFIISFIFVTSMFILPLKAAEQKTLSEAVSSMNNTSLSGTQKLLAAHGPREPQFFYGISASDISKILSLTPLSFDETRDEWGDPQFLIEIGDKEVVLWTYGCGDNKCDDLRLSTFWKGGDQTNTLKRTNEWNNEQRWTKAYVDVDHDAVLEADLDIRDGITPESILNFFEIYTAHVYKFSDYMVK